MDPCRRRLRLGPGPRSLSPTRPRGLANFWVAASRRALPPPACLASLPPLHFYLQPLPLCVCPGVWPVARMLRTERGVGAAAG